MSAKEGLSRVYAGLFARKNRVAQAVNHTLYHLALRGMGYNNGWQPDRSGEEWFVKNVLYKHGTALDIGANVGDYSRLLLKHTDMTVYAFEPLPEAFEQLEPRVLEGRGAFERFNVAMGAEPGQVTLHYGDPTTPHATGAVEARRIGYVAEGTTKEMVVEQWTVDGFMQKLVAPTHVDLIKIDVEGMEMSVLRGALKTIDIYHPRFIQIEWNLHQLMMGNTLLEFADVIGEDYEVYQMLPHGLRRVDPKRPEANTFCYANFVFIRTMR